MASHGEVFEGEQEPIVDRKTWSAVQALLAGGAGPRHNHGRNADYFLRGILRCACPSSPLPAEAIESYVVEQIREATADHSLAADVAESVKERVAERKGLPGKISSLSAEGKRLAEKIADVTGPARRLLDERLKEIGEAIQRVEVDEPKNEVRVFLTDLQPVPGKAVA